MTNLNKTREEIIYELVLSLNNGNCSYIGDRVEIAIRQYDEFVRCGVIKDIKEKEAECNHNWYKRQSEYNIITGMYECTYVCEKCGKLKTEIDE